MLCLMYMTFYTLKDAYLLSKEPLQQQNSRKNWSKSASHMRIVNTNQSLRSCLFCFHNEYNSCSYFDCVNLMIKLKVCFCAGLVNFSLLTHIKNSIKIFTGNISLHYRKVQKYEEGSLPNVSMPAYTNFLLLDGRWSICRWMWYRHRVSWR